MINTALDIIGAAVVLFALWGQFQKSWLWLLYAFGCSIYVYLNAVNGLWGQASINVIGMLIAVRNWKKVPTEEAAK